MKPFDLELAKAGHPVQTRDGRAVRILCYDRDDKIYPIVGLVKSKNKEKENLFTFTTNGESSIHSFTQEDLFMAPIKKEGWVNLYKTAIGEIYTDAKIYSTEEGARNDGEIITFYLCTAKIKWEE